MWNWLIWCWIKKSLSKKSYLWIRYFKKKLKNFIRKKNL